MKIVCMSVCITISVIMACSGSCSAMDPAQFRVILGVEVDKNSDIRDPFADIKKKLGSAHRVDTGDASTYEGRIEYMLVDRSQSVIFLTGECFRGYTVEYADRKSGSKYRTVLDRSIRKVETNGIALGMTKKEIMKIFNGKILGGWKIEKHTDKPYTQNFSYMKDEKSDGIVFCNHISIDLVYDAQLNLKKISVSTFGCDDSSCRE